MRRVLSAWMGFVDGRVPLALAAAAALVAVSVLFSDGGAVGSRKPTTAVTDAALTTLARSAQSGLGVVRSVENAQPADTPTGDPSANRTPSAADLSACFGAAPSDASCLSAALADIDAARADEGVVPMILPSDFGALTVPQQLLVVSDLERVDRGLPPFFGLSARLNGYAQQGAASSEDPPFPSPFDGTSGGSNWAGGATSALLDDFLWMYDDGPGSFNESCLVVGALGCWGHRHNILLVGDPPLVMGAALSGTSLTELFIGGDTQGDGVDVPTAPLWSSLATNLPVGFASSVTLALAQSSAQVPAWASGENMAVSAAITANATDWSVSPSSCDLTAGSSCELTLTDAAPGPNTGTLTLAGPNGTQTVPLARTGPPTVQIETPTDGATYAQNSNVTASYSCTEAPEGPGIETCTGPAADGDFVDTSGVGPHAFDVTATSASGQTGTAVVSYTVAGWPTASIVSPADGASYVQGQAVDANYSCSDGSFGPGIAASGGCVGSDADGAPIDTSTPGRWGFTVFATSRDGQVGLATVSFTVTAAPQTDNGNPPVKMDHGPPASKDTTSPNATTSALAIVAGAVTAAANGAVAIKVTCSGLPCSGVLQLTVPVKNTTGNRGATKTITTALKIGSARFARLPVGSDHVLLRLNSAGLRLFKKHGYRLSSTATAKYTSGATSRTATGSVSLKGKAQD